MAQKLVWPHQTAKKNGTMGFLCSRPSAHPQAAQLRTPHSIAMHPIRKSECAREGGDGTSSQHEGRGMHCISYVAWPPCKLRQVLSQHVPALGPRPFSASCSTQSLATWTERWVSGMSGLRWVEQMRHLLAKALQWTSVDLQVLEQAAYLPVAFLDSRVVADARVRLEYDLSRLSGGVLRCGTCRSLAVSMRHALPSCQGSSGFCAHRQHQLSHHALRYSSDICGFAQPDLQSKSSLLDSLVLSGAG